jgi:hypothetical protein
MISRSGILGRTVSARTELRWNFGKSVSKLQS